MSREFEYCNGVLEAQQAVHRRRSKPNPVKLINWSQELQAPHACSATKQGIWELEEPNCSLTTPMLTVPARQQDSEVRRGVMVSCRSVRSGTHNRLFTPTPKLARLYWTVDAHVDY